MISGDSTASHMGSVKNIEKARERRTFEVMPGSSAADLPDELQEQTQTIHPRMGYDMSDSLFMQHQEAAGREKESRRALEERAALEAFRAAALKKPFDPAAVATGAKGDGGPGSGAGGVGADSRRKEPPPPLAGIKLRKKTSRPGTSSSPSPAAEASGVYSPQAGGGQAVARGESPGAGGKRSVDTQGGGEASEGGAPKKRDREDGGAKRSKKKKSSKKSKSKTGKHSKSAHEGGGGVGGESGKGGAAAEASAGLGLGLVAYSSGDDDEEES
ncbi:unnamed protein product [Ectocarpus sp. CCAP 1310/34]|nr:unnamed protein product [Ectocarpus sp. CCAP 1310/34]